MTEIKQKWKKIYSVVLIANLIYIIIFYLITKTFAN
jgi:hypothetical protein